MKKIFLCYRALFFLLFIINTALISAQVSKTVECIPGKLDSILTFTEENTITHLTLTGQMDARDFKLIRNEIDNLEFLDLSNVTIVAYTGTAGPKSTWNDSSTPYTIYPENSIPEWAMSYLYYGSGAAGKNTLQEIILPVNCNAIGYNAFGHCKNLSQVQWSQNVKIIEGNAFTHCTSLQNVSLPDSIEKIEAKAFEYCDMLTDFVFPPLVTTVASFVLSKCPSLVNVVLHSNIRKIESYAFFGSQGLETITLPASIDTIEGYVFNNTTGLTSIYCYRRLPVSLVNSTNVFYPMNLWGTVDLYVLPGSEVVYKAANQWKELNIYEVVPTMSLPDTSIFIDYNETVDVINISSGSAWTARSNASWLEISPESGGAGPGIVSYTITENLMETTREAQIEFFISGSLDGVVSIVQGPAPCGPTFITVDTVTCGIFELNGVNHTTSGVHNDTLKNFCGGDSVITYNLTIYTVPQIAYDLTGCESVTHNDSIYTSSGQYDQEFGCDSLVILNVTIDTMPQNLTIVGPDTLFAGDYPQLYTATSGGAELYEWTMNGSSMGADQDVTIDPIKKDTVQLGVIAVQGECETSEVQKEVIIDSVEIADEIADGIGENLFASIKFYNPSPQMLEIESSVIIEKVSLYSLTGVEISSFTVNSTNIITEVPEAGIYIVQLSINSGAFRKKVLIW